MVPKKKGGNMLNDYSYKVKICNLNPFPNKPWFLRVCSTCHLKTLWGKGEIARYEQFLLFSQYFQQVQKTSCRFHQIWNYHLQTLSVWKGVKFVVWERVKGRKIPETILG